MNRYAALDNLQESVKVSRNLNKSGKVASTWNRNKSHPKTKKKKIVIIGNSHARGYVAELSSDLGQDFEVTGTVIPCARLEIIANFAVEEISSLEKSDAVIVIGGTNDINKNESNIGLTHLRKFVENRKNTNIMVVAPPHRFDLHESSCVNNEIVVFNRKLHKSVKTAGNVKVIQVPLNRSDFTRHGMHLNTSDKIKAAKLLGENIKKLRSRKEETPILLNWKENQTDTHLKDAEVKPINDDNKEPNLKATVVSKDCEVSQDQIGKPTPTTTTKTNNAPTRTSTHTK